MKLSKNGVGTVNPSTKYKVYSQFVVNLTTLLLFQCCFTVWNQLNLSLLSCKKRNQDIYQAYCIIDKVLSDLRGIQSNIHTEFKVWFTFAVNMAKSVGAGRSLPRTARCWIRYRNNVPGEDSET